METAWLNSLSPTGIFEKQQHSRAHMTSPEMAMVLMRLYPCYVFYAASDRVSLFIRGVLAPWYIKHSNTLRSLCFDLKSDSDRNYILTDKRSPFRQMAHDTIFGKSLDEDVLVGRCWKGSRSADPDSRKSVLFYELNQTMRGNVLCLPQPLQEYDTVVLTTLYAKPENAEELGVHFAKCRLTVQKYLNSDLNLYFMQSMVAWPITAIQLACCVAIQKSDHKFDIAFGGGFPAARAKVIKRWMSSFQRVCKNEHTLESAIQRYREKLTAHDT